ncbi:hypothetical protein ACFE04_022894 [Oxalis oulophora]
MDKQAMLDMAVEYIKYLQKEVKTIILVKKTQSRKRFFNMINDLPTIFEIVTGAIKKPQKEKLSTTENNNGKSKSTSKVYTLLPHRSRMTNNDEGKLITLSARSVSELTMRENKSSNLTIEEKKWIAEQSIMCYQCQRNDKGCVVLYLNCKRKRYCISCATAWPLYKKLDIRSCLGMKINKSDDVDYVLCRLKKTEPLGPRKNKKKLCIRLDEM